MRIRLRFPVAAVLVLLAAASVSRAQQSAAAGDAVQKPEANIAAEPSPAAQANSFPQGVDTNVGSAPTTHRFWDRENDLLFALVGAGRALDYTSTLNMRRRGVTEVFLTNSVVDNHPLFGGIEAAATAASIGVSYLFHRTGHHRLERWTSIVHFGVAAGGAARNYALKTVH